LDPPEQALEGWTFGAPVSPPDPGVESLDESIEDRVKRIAATPFAPEPENILTYPGPDILRGIGGTLPKESDSLTLGELKFSEVEAAKRAQFEGTPFDPVGEGVNLPLDAGTVPLKDATADTLGPSDAQRELLLSTDAYKAGALPTTVPEATFTELLTGKSAVQVAKEVAAMMPEAPKAGQQIKSGTQPYRTASPTSIAPVFNPVDAAKLTTTDTPVDLTPSPSIADIPSAEIGEPPVLPVSPEADYSLEGAALKRYEDLPAFPTTSPSAPSFQGTLEGTVGKLLSGVVSPITGALSGAPQSAAQGALSAIALGDVLAQLAGGAKIEDIALKRLQRGAVKMGAQAATQTAAQAAIKGLDLTGTGAALAANLGIAAVPGLSALANVALSDRPVTIENVAPAAIMAGMQSAPSMALQMAITQAGSAKAAAAAGAGAYAAGTSLPMTTAGMAAATAPMAAMMLAKTAMDMKFAKEKTLFRKREYEDRAFSAPIANLHPNLSNIQQSTEHSSESIDKLFKDSWAGERNYLGQQLAKELDPPDGARYYHGDESVRKMMENTLGVIQKYRNTVPAYDNVWNQFKRGQISQGEFKAQSQRAIDNYIVGKLGAKRILKPGEVRIYNARSGEWASTTSIVDLNTSGGAEKYYNITGVEPPGWAQEVIDYEYDEYRWINIAEREKKAAAKLKASGMTQAEWEYMEDPGQWD
jgi:hypothetical protein